MNRFAPLPELYVTEAAAQGLREDAARRLCWQLDAAQLRDLGLLMDGAMLPLRGYLSQTDAASVRDRGRLGSGAFWPLPLVLEVLDDFARDLETGEDIALAAPDGRVLAMMSVTDRWGGGPVRLGGRVKGLLPVPGRDAARTPNALRARFRASGAVRVLAEPGPGLTLRPDQGEAVVLALAGDPAWQVIVARNHGATHLVTAGDAALGRVAAELGLEPVG
jgi:sulfate adenylyltransferase